MSNTLETKTPEQLAAALHSYNSCMCEIPEEFPVLAEYRHGLPPPKFCRAFRRLAGIFTEVYDFLIRHPESIGLMTQDKKSGTFI